MAPTLELLLAGAAALAASAGLRLLHARYYRDPTPALVAIGLVDRRGATRRSPYKRWDALYCTFPFAWAWLEIGAASAAATAARHWLGGCLLALIVGGRLRALHEFSHLSVHGALARSKKWQWALADVAFHYPFARFDSHHRHIHHVKRHHPHSNQPGNDPNIDRLVSAGFVPGLSVPGFYAKLLHPLTPAGVWLTLTGLLAELGLNRSWAGVCQRWGVMLATVAGFFALFGARGIVFGYVLPRLLVYPTYSWIALIAEHRWFARSSAVGRAREYECGRPTDYSGLSGWLVTSFISPAADHYHLAHSLYPHVRWNHLPEVDRILKQTVPAYATRVSVGLLAKGGDGPSALSELRDRVTDESHPDLADWALRLTTPDRLASPVQAATPRPDSGASSAARLPNRAERGSNRTAHPITRPS